MRTGFRPVIAAPLLLLYACTNQALPIGTAVRVSQFAPCAPTEGGLNQILGAQRSGEMAFYKALDQYQAITLNAGDAATVITALPDKVRLRLPDGAVNRLRDNTCWIARTALAP